MKFGQYSIIDGITFNFEKEPNWSWSLKPVTSGTELEMSKFTTHNRMITGPDGQRRELPPTWLEIAHREIAMTFDGTSIPEDTGKSVEDGGKPLLAKDSPIEEVEKVLRAMPQDMVLEIWKQVGKVYPHWGPALPNV